MRASCIRTRVSVPLDRRILITILKKYARGVFRPASPLIARLHGQVAEAGQDRVRDRIGDTAKARAYSARCGFVHPAGRVERIYYLVEYAVETGFQARAVSL